MTSKVDICLVVDYTSSMEPFMRAAKKAIREFIPTFGICKHIGRISILGYGDYCDPHVTKWSGWTKVYQAQSLIKFVDNLGLSWGGDRPEAVKTGIKQLIDHIRMKKKKKRTIVILLTDAPPHSKATGSNSSNMNAEMKTLGKYFDWSVLSEELASVGGSVWTILSSSCNLTVTMYAYLSKITAGKTLRLAHVDSDIIGRTIVGLVFAQFGLEYGYDGVTECRIMDETMKISSENDVYFLSFEIVDVVMPQVDAVAKKEMIHMFKTDPDYKKRVYNVFMTVLTDDLIMSLSYNPLLGTLWREICNDKDSKARSTLMDCLSSIIGRMEGKDKEVLQTMIAQSYNREDDVREIVESVGADARYPALAYIGPDLNMKAKDVLAISRSCDASSLKILGNVLNNLLIVDTPTMEDVVDTSIKSLPLALPNTDLFKCLSALIAKGVMQSKRGAVVMAMLAVYTNAQILFDKAFQYLNDMRGTWFNATSPENFSFEFVKFVRKVDVVMRQHGGASLTDEEKVLFDDVYKLGGWRINGDTNINIETAYSSNKTIRWDWKKECSQCGQHRSLTLLNKNGVCGLCINYGPGDEKMIRCKDKMKSYMYECVNCRVHYAVENAHHLREAPRCHFCRNGEVAPFITCGKCTNKFVDCIGSSQSDSWECAECKNGGRTANDVSVVPIKDIVTTDVLKIIMSSKSIWAVYDEVMNKKVVLPDADYIHQWNGKPILNHVGVIKDIEGWIKEGMAEWDTCLSCLSDMPKHKLQHMCKRKQCGAQVCLDCIGAWYGGVRRGCIVNVGNLKCAFCRQAPHMSVLNKYNKELRAVHNIPNQWDHNWHYAWCMYCDEIKTCIERNCARETNWDSASVENFICVGCADGTIVVKECPGCKVTTMKSSGCNHMSCPCGVHWCYTCEKAFTSGTIYGHMREEHGGIGWAAVTPGDDEEDYYYY